MMELYDFQKEALEKVKGHKQVAFYLDMGLGKTFVGAEQMKRFGNPLNILVCQKSKVNDWMEHFLTHYPEYATFNGTETLNGLAVEGRKRVVVINYDLLIRRPVLLDEFPDRTTLILDESSLIQNYQTKRWKTVRKINYDNLILLSGTPVSGKYEKLYTQIQLLNPNFRMKMSEFWDRYVIYDTINVGYPIKIARSYKNVDDLKQRWLSKNVVWKKTEEVLELPEKRFIDVFAKSEPQYRRFIKSKVIEIDGETVTADNPLTLLSYARQICSWNAEKMEKFREILTGTEDRVVVFYNFKKELKSLKAIALKVGKTISTVNGEEKNIGAYENCENSVTFVQYQAGSMGLNLQKANKIIFASPTLSCDMYMQAQKRIHRIGQVNRCTYYRFMTEKTVEEKIYRALERGEDYTEKLFIAEVPDGT